MSLTEQDFTRLERITPSFVNRQLQKGMAMEVFDYNSNFKVTKDGKFIKEKLVLYKASLDADIAAKNVYLMSCKAKLPQGLVAADEPSSYIFEGIRKSAFGNYPKMFSYETRKQYRGEHMQERAYPTMGSVNVKVDVVEKETTYSVMDKYNDCARSLIRKMADSIYLQSLIDNIGDKDKFELNSRMLKILI